MTELRDLFISDGVNGNRAQVDGVGNALVGITYVHHEVHEGDAFICGGVDTSMGATDTVIIAFKTPAAATKRIHMVVQWSAKAAAHAEVIEGPTWDPSSGTALPIYNRHRNSGTSSTLLEDRSTGSFIASDEMILNPTTFAGGTTIRTMYAWAAKSVGTQARDAEELILKAETLYGFKGTADAASNAIFIGFDWYEHADSN